MRQKYCLLILLFLGLESSAQDRRNWNTLDYLNRDPDYTFTPEKEFIGNCFITLSDSVDYYLMPILLVDENDKLIVSIEFNDSLGILTRYKGKTYTSHDTTNPINPWLWSPNPDYFSLAFQCTDTIGDLYKIWLNEMDYIRIKKNNKDFKKEEINEFILGWTGEALGFEFNRETNPLKNEPNPASETIQNTDQDVYKIWHGTSLEMEGDWLKVKTDKGEVGWIRWRENSKLLISMNFAC